MAVRRVTRFVQVAGVDEGRLIRNVEEAMNVAHGPFIHVRQFKHANKVIWSRRYASERCCLEWEGEPRPETQPPNSIGMMIHPYAGEHSDVYSRSAALLVCTLQ